MKKYLTPIILCTVGLISACSNATNSSKDVDKAPKEAVIKTVSAEDQKIIDKYESYFKYYREGNFEEFQNKIKEILPEVSTISDKKKREFMQMNIYMTLQNYNDAYALNEKQLKEKPNDTARLTFRCQLLTLQKKEATLINKCYDNLADVLKVELDKPENKSNPDYKIGEFSYLFAKYKAGHTEYKQKMQEYIAETKDEKLKASLTSLYDVEFEN